MKISLKNRLFLILYFISFRVFTTQKVLDLVIQDLLHSTLVFNTFLYLIFLLFMSLKRRKAWILQCTVSQDHLATLVFFNTLFFFFSCRLKRMRDWI